MASFGTSFADCTFIAWCYEFFPVHPSAIGAMKTPFAITRPGYEQSPARPVVKLDAMRETSGWPEAPITSDQHPAMVDTTVSYRVFRVATAQQDGQANPRMIVKRPII